MEVGLSWLGVTAVFTFLEPRSSWSHEDPVAEEDLWNWVPEFPSIASAAVPLEEEAPVTGWKVMAERQ